MAKKSTVLTGLFLLVFSVLAFATSSETQDHSEEGSHGATAQHEDHDTHHGDGHYGDDAHESHDDAGHGHDDHAAEGDGHGDGHNDHHGDDHYGEAHGDSHGADHGDGHGGHGEHHDECGLHDDHHGESDGYDPTPMILHHISDANEWHITEGLTIPLPCITYAKGEGIKVIMSNRFEHGHTAVDRYVLDHGRLLRIEDKSFPMGEVHLASSHFAHKEIKVGSKVNKETGEEEDIMGERTLICHGGQVYVAYRHNIFDHGFNYEWYDFSITKNVATLFLVAIIMFWVFLAVAATYRSRAGMAPTGLQNFMEPLIMFVRDDIAVANIGEEKADKYVPYLMTAFFFIWIANLIGQIPFIGNPNLTGNIAVTLFLSLVTFFITQFAGTKTYWSHVFTAPGSPGFVKPILIPIEILGIFTKPFALMIRLFANITAGHIIVLSLTALIFVFGNAGESMGGSLGGAAIAIPFVLFISLIELLVAFLQAFIFTMLSALFIGLALEDHH